MACCSSSSASCCNAASTSNSFTDSSSSSSSSSSSNTSNSSTRDWSHLNLPPRFYDDDDDEHPQEECGIFGVYSNSSNAAITTFFALHALQHRGQEMAGIATCDGSIVNVHKGLGLVSQIFTEEHTKLLIGNIGVGHTRYSTAGGKSLNNAQPFVLETDLGKVAVAHNGQLTRQKFLRKLLLQRGTGLFTNSDSEILAQMLAHPASGNIYQQTPNSPIPLSPTSTAQTPSRKKPQHLTPQHQQQYQQHQYIHHQSTNTSHQNNPQQQQPNGLNAVFAAEATEHSQTNGHSNLAIDVVPPVYQNGSTVPIVAPVVSSAIRRSPSHLLLQPAPSHDDTSIAYDGLVSIHRQDSLLNDRRHGRIDHWQRRLIDLMNDAEGAYALVMLVPGAVYGCRDRFGIRPLCLGNKTNSDGSISYALASESCGFGPIGFSYVREISPGEIIRLNINGIASIQAVQEEQKAIIRPALCVFEYVYFARPDTLLEDQLVHTVRQRLGRRLAIESPVKADIVAGVPDSSIAAAIGFSMQSGIPFMEVLCKNRYIGRTFIQPDQAMRENSIRLKFNPLSENLRGKKIILVDDSLVRGNTLKQLIPLLKGAGAIEVHIRISSPVLRHPCYMGVDIGTYDEILATHMNSTETMRDFITADSLEFLSHEGMIQAVTEGVKRDPDQIGYCSACTQTNLSHNMQLLAAANPSNKQAANRPFLISHSCLVCCLLLVLLNDRF